MARFAPVVPIHIARHLQGSETFKDYLGSYHLLLAHDVLDKPVDYKQVYNEVRKRYPEAFIIMDNSVVETGTALRINDLLEACRIVQSDCLVVPDVMGDGTSTREMAKHFVKEYVQHASAQSYSVPSLMGVLQGQSQEDVLETLAVMYTLPMVDYISVPRVLTERLGSRMPILMALAERRTYDLFEGVHLLGFSDNVLDDITCARVPFVMGIDSAVPIRAGLKEEMINEALHSPGEFRMKVGPRGDFWKDSIPDWAARKWAVELNLGEVRDWIQL